MLIPELDSMSSGGQTPGRSGGTTPGRTSGRTTPTLPSPRGGGGSFNEGRTKAASVESVESLDDADEDLRMEAERLAWQAAARERAERERVARARGGSVPEDRRSVRSSVNLESERSSCDLSTSERSVEAARGARNSVVEAKEQLEEAEEAAKQRSNEAIGLQKSLSMEQRQRSLRATASSGLQGSRGAGSFTGYNSGSASDFEAFSPATRRATAAMASMSAMSGKSRTGSFESAAGDLGPIDDADDEEAEEGVGRPRTVTQETLQKQESWLNRMLFGAAEAEEESMRHEEEEAEEVRQVQRRPLPSPAPRHLSCSLSQPALAFAPGARRARLDRRRRSRADGAARLPRQGSARLAAHPQGERSARGRES